MKRIMLAVMVLTARLGVNAADTTKVWAEFASMHPYRVVEGKTNCVLAPGWYRITGTILETREDGIRIHGTLYRPGYYDGSCREFFVKGLPYSFVDGDYIISNFGILGKLVAHYSYMSPYGRNRTILCLDYGEPCEPPQPPKELEERRKVALEKARIETMTAALKFHQELASRDDAYGLYQMGRRYTVGDGVEKDEVQGREYLEKAANLDCVEAKAALKKYFPTEAEIASK